MTTISFILKVLGVIVLAALLVCYIASLVQKYREQKVLNRFANIAERVPTAAEREFVLAVRELVRLSSGHYDTIVVQDMIGKIEQLQKQVEYKSEGERKFTVTMSTGIEASIKGFREKGFTDEQINELFNMSMDRMLRGQH